MTNHSLGLRALLCFCCTVGLISGCSDEAADVVGGVSDVAVDGSEDDGDAGVDDSSNTDAGTTDGSVDDAVDDAVTAGPSDGLWSMGVSFAELGGLEVAAQLELSDVTDDAIGGLALRFVNDEGVSDVIVVASDVLYDDSGFTAEFGEFTLPAAYSPTASDVGLSLSLIATGVSSDFFCGTVSGEVIDFGIDVTRSTFGAIPWETQPGQPLPLDCEWVPGAAVDRATETIGTEERPARLDFPMQYDTEQSWPVVVVLHGFGATGEVQAQYFGLNALIDELGYLLVVPDGTANSRGAQFWNATEACCGFGSGVDDLGYLTGLVNEVVAEHGGEATKVYFIGHSNGGFMSHRIACDRPDIITGLINLAGAGTNNEQDCQPTEAVGIVNIHGTDDATIEFDGRSGDFGFPSAGALTERWANLNGCAGELGAAAAFDYEPTIDGDETDRQDIDGCPIDGPVSLWTVNGGSHIPAFDSVVLIRDALALLGLSAE